MTGPDAPQSQTQDVEDDAKMRKRRRRTCWMTPRDWVVIHRHDFWTEQDLSWAVWNKTVTIDRFCQCHPPTSWLWDFGHIETALEIFIRPDQSFFFCKNPIPPLTTEKKLRHVLCDDVLSPIWHFDVHDETLGFSITIVYDLRDPHQTTQDLSSIHLSCVIEFDEFTNVTIHQKPLRQSASETQIIGPLRRRSSWRFSFSTRLGSKRASRCPLHWSDPSNSLEEELRKFLPNPDILLCKSLSRRNRQYELDFFDSSPLLPGLLHIDGKIDLPHLQVDSKSSSAPYWEDPQIQTQTSHRAANWDQWSPITANHSTRKKQTPYANDRLLCCNWLTPTPHSLDKKGQTADLAETCLSSRMSD